MNLNHEMIERGGKRFWQFSDGTLLPVVSGASTPSPATTGFEQGRQEGGDPAQQPPAQPTVTVVEPGQQPAPPQGGTTYTEDQMRERLEAARQEEKNKLYPQLQGREALEARIKELEGNESARAKAEKDRKAAEEKAAREAAEKEMDAKQLIESRTSDWEKREADLRREIEESRAEASRTAALFEKERQFSQLQEYKARRMQEESDKIIPQLRHLVVGGNEAEVESSIADLIQSSAGIVSDVQGQQAAARQAQPTAPPTGAPPVGPMEASPMNRTLTPEEIQSMDMNDYAKLRGPLGVTRGQQSRGMFS